MDRIRANIIANFIGRIVTSGAAFCAVPFYINFVGFESYGLIGFLTSLQALFNIFDFGISGAINRELARYSLDPNAAHKMRIIAYTLERLYWAVGVGIGLFVIASSSLISQRWLTSS